MGPEVLEMGMGPGDLMDLLDMGPLAALGGFSVDSPGGPGGELTDEGPVSRGGMGQGGLATLFDMVDQQIQQAAKSGGDFEVKRLGDRMQLVASLPDYKEDPPSVEVLGHSLIVRGQKTTGSMVHSFQRSFQLPQGADVDNIHVEYSKVDGKFSVDVPINAKASAAKGGSSAAMTLSSDSASDDGPPLMDMLDPLSGGSQMTFTFSSGGPGPRAPVIDPLMELLLGHSPFERLGLPGMAVVQEQPARGAGSPRRKAPVAVHSKDAKPFWRLVNDGLFDKKGLAVDPAIEIVAPRGVQLGKVRNGRVDMYNATGEDALRGQRAPAGHLALPVNVSERDCKWASGPDSVSPWLPLWMLGGTGLVVGAIMHYLAGRQRAAGKAGRRFEARLVRLGQGVCVCCLLCGVLLSSCLLYRHRQLELEERVLHCRVNPADLRRVGVRVQGEL